MLDRSGVRRGSDINRINRSITAARVRLIDSEGNMVGVVEIDKALAMAAAQNLDLVEVAASRDEKEPVCKILSYSKFVYDNQKRTHMMKKKQKVVKVKEIKMRPNIGAGDYLLKAKSAREFLDEGHRVRVSVRLRGREVLFKDLAIDLLHKLQNDLEDVGHPESPIKREGVQFSAIFVSNK